MKVPFFARKNGSWVRSTPIYSKGTLYVGGIRDVLRAIDGKQVKRNGVLILSNKKNQQFLLLGSYHHR